MSWQRSPSRTLQLIGYLVAAPLHDGEIEARGTWKVKRRTIVLDANVLLDENLSIFL